MTKKKGFLFKQANFKHVRVQTKKLNTTLEEGQSINFRIKVNKADDRKRERKKKPQVYP